MHDLAIVGGGPAGLLTARRCAEAGLDVVLLEEHAELGEPTHCTGIISLEATALAKIPDEIVLGRLKRARLVSPGGAACEMSWTASGTEEILVIDRGQFDRGLAELGELLGVTAPPLLSRVSRYPKAMPQYHVGHLARVEAIEGCLRAHPGLELVGGAYRGVGISDCVRSGEEAAARLLAPVGA